MSEELWPEQSIPFKLHTQVVHIAAMDDWPREAVYIHDWYLSGAEITLLVDSEDDTDPQDCQEVPLHMIEEMQDAS